MPRAPELRSMPRFFSRIRLTSMISTSMRTSPLGLSQEAEELLGQGHGLGRVPDRDRVEVLVDLDGRDLVHRLDHLGQAHLDVARVDVGEVERLDGVELVLHPLLDVVGDDDDRPLVDDAGEVLAGDAEEVDGLLEVLAGQVDGQVGVAEGVVVEEVDAGDAAQGLEDRAQGDVVAEAQVEGLARALELDRPLDPLAGPLRASRAARSGP